MIILLAIGVFRWTVFVPGSETRTVTAVGQVTTAQDVSRFVSRQWHLAGVIGFFHREYKV